MFGDMELEFAYEVESIFSDNVKEHAPPLAGASVGRGVRVVVKLDHVNRAASGGCCVSSC